MFKNQPGDTEKPDSVPRETREFLRYVLCRHGQKQVAAWLSTPRQHIGQELPKAGRYCVALTAALGPDAARALTAAIYEGLRLFYRGPAQGLEPLSDYELFVREELAAGRRPAEMEAP